MLLQSNEICWRPDLSDGGDGEGESVLHMFRQWSKRYLATGDLMKRLDVGEGTYGREIEEDYDVMYAFSTLQVRPFILLSVGTQHTVTMPHMVKKAHALHSYATNTHLHCALDSTRAKSVLCCEYP